MSLGLTGLGLAALRAMNAGLGLLLNIGLAIVFGVNRDVDVLFVAMSIAVFLARDLSRVIRTAAIPCLVRTHDGGQSSRFAASLNLTSAALAFASAVVVWVSAPLVVKITSPGFDSATSGEAARLLRAMSPSLLLFILFGSAQAAFHARRRFLLPELGETVWRITAVLALSTLGRRYGVEAYAVGLTVAAFAQWAMLLAAGVRLGIEVLPSRLERPDWKSLRPFWLGATVVLCSVAQMQVEAAFDRAALSFMRPGSIALFSYGERLAHMMPLLLSTSLLVPWLPEITRIHARAGDPKRLAKQGSLFLAGLGALLAVVIAWASRDLVNMLLVRGKFQPEAAGTVVTTVRAFAAGIPFIFCVQCLAGLYIVEQDLKAMARLAFLAVAAHLVGNLALFRSGVAGIALSGSITVTILALHLWRDIREKEQIWFPWWRFLAAMAAVCAVLFAPPWGLLVGWAPARMAVGGAAAWAAYMAVMWSALGRMQEYERQATGPDAGSSPDSATD
jgi:putative peptidoglycan lipid II flippase